MRAKTLFLTMLVTMMCAGTSYAVQSHAEESALRDLKAGDFLDMKARDFAELTGTKLKLRDRLAISLAKKQVRKEMRKGTMTAGDSVADVAQQAAKDINVGAFFLGLFLGLLGLIIVLIAFEDKEAWKSALLGWGIWILLLILLISI